MWVLMMSGSGDRVVEREARERRVSEASEEKEKRADMRLKAVSKDESTPLLSLDFLFSWSLLPSPCVLIVFPVLSSLLFLSRECSSGAGVASGMAWSLAWSVREGLTSLQESPPNQRGCLSISRTAFLWRFSMAYSWRFFFSFSFLGKKKGARPVDDQIGGNSRAVGR